MKLAFWWEKTLNKQENKYLHEFPEMINAYAVKEIKQAM